MTPSFDSFKDELVKIALFQRVTTGFSNALKEGWHGTGPVGSDTRNTWFGKGSNDLRPSYDPNKWGGSHMPISPNQVAAGHRFRPTTGTRFKEQLFSLGGLTKALPIGAKSMMAASTAMMAAQALKKEDPTNQERSRAERLSGVAANTVGGLVGSSLALKAFKGRGGGLGAIAAPLIGGGLGALAAEKVVTSPFRRTRTTRSISSPQSTTMGQSNVVPENTP